MRIKYDRQTDIFRERKLSSANVATMHLPACKMRGVGICGFSCRSIYARGYSLIEHKEVVLPTLSNDGARMPCRLFPRLMLHGDQTGLYVLAIREFRHLCLENACLTQRSRHSNGDLYRTVFFLNKDIPNLSLALVCSPYEPV